MKKLSNGYRSFAATNADRQERVRAICFPELPTVPIVEKSYITATRKTLRYGRIILSVLPLGKKARMHAKHTSSAQ